MIGRASWIALLAAGAGAVAMPVLLLWPSAGAPPAPPRPLRPLVVRMPPPLAHVFDRPLFAAAEAEASPPPADAPQLTGIVGRLGSDAVALVRTAQGGSRSLAIGDSIDGWKLESLAIDAALFSRGGQRARVPLPAADDAAAAAQ